MNNTKIITKRNLTTVIAVILMAAALVVGAGTVAAGNSHMAFAYKKVKEAAQAGGNDNGNTVVNQVSQLKVKVSGHRNLVKQENPTVLCTHPANNASCLSEGPGNSPVTVTVPVTNTNTNDNSASSSSSSEATASNTNDITNTVIVTNGTLPPVGTTSALKILGLGTVKVTSTTPDSDGNCLRSQIHATSNTGPVCLSIKK